MEETPVYSAPFGELVKRYRKRKKVTQRQLAEKLGVHFNTVWSWERGDHLPDTKGMVLELARHLGLHEQDTRHLLEASLTTVLPHWTIPYQRNRFFTGRDETLKYLHDLLSQKNMAVLTQSLALSGLGGIGKTQLAVEYAYRHAHDYSALFWMSADSPETMGASYLSIASQLNLSEQQEFNQNTLVAAVIQWLTNHGNWLLIIDNLEEQELVHPLLPATRSGSLLLTTRLQALGTIAHPLEMVLMTGEEGAQLLLRRARRILPEEKLDTASAHEITLAMSIVKVLDGLPLAIDQAGAYIEETQCSLADYLSLYQSHALSLLHKRDTQADYSTSVGGTFALAFEKLQQRNPAAIELLRACSFLAPDAIPERLFVEGASLLGPLLQSLITHPRQYNQAMRDLLAYSLIHRQGEASIVMIHRLVQTVFRESMSEEVQKEWIERIIVVIDHTFPSDRQTQLSLEQWKWCRQLLPHALLSSTLSNQWADAFPDIAPFLMKTANYLRDMAHYREAEPLYTRAVTKYRQQLGPFHPQTAISLLHMGLLYEYQGRDTEAEPLYQQALTICERELGPTHSETAQALNTLAALYDYQGKYREAEPLYLRALLICEQTLGSSHLDTAQALNNLAVLYGRQERYADAEPLLQRSLTIREQKIGPLHPSTAAGLNNLATLYQKQGKYTEAEPLYQRALTICEQELGPTHPNTATILNHLATVSQKQGKYTEAEPLYQRALTICEQELGPTHLNTATSLSSLARLYRDQGRVEDAEQLLLRALTIREQGLEPFHPDIAQNLYDIALLFQDQRRPAEAQTFLQRAFTIAHQGLGTEHSLTKEITQTLNKR